MVSRIAFACVGLFGLVAGSPVAAHPAAVAQVVGDPTGISPPAMHTLVDGCECGSCVVGDVHGAAARELQMARLDQRYYRRVEYPQRMRSLRAEVRYSEARIRYLRDTLERYRPFTHFTQGAPLTVTIGQTRLALEREELYLAELRQRLAREHRYHREHKRMHAHRVQRAAQQLANHVAAAAPPAHDPALPRIEVVNH